MIIHCPEQNEPVASVCFPGNRCPHNFTNRNNVLHSWKTAQPSCASVLWAPSGNALLWAVRQLQTAVMLEPGTCGRHTPAVTELLVVPLPTGPPGLCTQMGRTHILYSENVAHCFFAASPLHSHFQPCSKLAHRLYPDTGTTGKHLCKCLGTDVYCNKKSISYLVSAKHIGYATVLFFILFFSVVHYP